MTPALLHRLIVAVSDDVIAHADELTALDQAVGDGDHGVNMKRGFEAVRADARSDGGEAAAGSAEGDRHATRYESRRRLRPALRHSFPCAEQGDRPGRLESCRRPLASAVEAVKARGKSQPGQKTMLDVLTPVQTALAEGGADLPARLPIVAASAAEATIPMLATRGRASFLGERSIGHMDPGARSSALMVASVCRALEG